MDIRISDKYKDVNISTDLGIRVKVDKESIVNLEKDITREDGQPITGYHKALAITVLYPLAQEEIDLNKFSKNRQYINLDFKNPRF
jgi:hypothetical protein